MAIYLTNTIGLFAMRCLNNATKSLDVSYARLASGKRINSAKDDAAGLQISNRLTSEINGLVQGNRNAQDGISLAQTAEGAMEEITNMLQRVRTLALQSSNGTYSASERMALSEEAKQLSEEINRISRDSTFAGQKILDGSKGVVSIQVGAYANQTINYSLDYSCSLSGLAKLVGGDAEDLWGDEDSFFDLSTAESSQDVLANIDSIINMVSSKRANLGAVQNRLEHTINYQSNSIVNLSDARSRILDTDYAEEVANMTQQSIIQQAAMAVLSQANQRQQFILSLINSAIGR